MELRDLIVTPFILFTVYLVAYIVRPHVTDQVTRAYFFPALTLRIIGALAVGFVYQFYYNGGDTFNYHTHGSRVIWDTFVESPWLGIKLLLNDSSAPGAYSPISKIYFFHDKSAFAIIQIATFFDLFTFSTYSATAIFFAVLGFAGSWMMFLPFYDMYKHLHRWIAISIFFIPSVLFWGSGILKDTITYACVGGTLFAAYNLFVKKKFKISNYILLLISVVALYKIKIYILLTFIPAVILWISFENLGHIKNRIARGFIAPLVILLAAGVAVFAALKAGQDNPKYSLNKIAFTTRETAYDILYYSGKGAGSGYTLGELDGTFDSMFKLAPQAIIVSLFRPFLWEANNPLMLISSLEATFFLCFLIYTIMKSNFFFLKTLTNPTVAFCLGFSVFFAFSVGVSTYNFGTLVRYKIPLLPFFTIALVLIGDLSRQERIKRLLN